MDTEAHILRSWRRNADAWVEAVRNGSIASRGAVTDAAVVAAVMRCTPDRVLDIGCGEGWLARQLAERGITVHGSDAVPALVEQARAAGGGRFRCLAHDALGEFADLPPFDCAVCNFSLLGDASTRAVFRAVPALLASHGRFIVQTVSPDAGRPEAEGWRDGAWAGLGPAFSDPAPWYQRGPAGWRRLFLEYGFRDVTVATPNWPDGRPASLLLSATPAHHR